MDGPTLIRIRYTNERYSNIPVIHCGKSGHIPSADHNSVLTFPPAENVSYIVLDGHIYASLRLDASLSFTVSFSCIGRSCYNPLARSQNKAKFWTMEVITQDRGCYLFGDMDMQSMAWVCFNERVRGSGFVEDSDEKPPQLVTDESDQEERAKSPTPDPLDDMELNNNLSNMERGLHVHCHSDPLTDGELDIILSNIEMGLYFRRFKKPKPSRVKQRI